MNTRCGISEHEFHQIFDSVEDCVLAAFEEGLRWLARIVTGAVECEDAWPDRVRAGLSALLAFLDEAPGWGRFLISESPPVATAAVLERRRRALGSLADALVKEAQSDADGAGWFVSSRDLTAELIVGGVFSMISARIGHENATILVELEPSLMAFILAPYRSPEGRLGTDDAEAQESGGRRPIRATYRTTRVLSAIGDSPGLSNREIADAAGLTDEGQTSKLLRRLEQRGVVQNVGLGQPCGGANAWLLTAYGERVRDATRQSLVPGAGAVMRRRARGAA